MISDTVGDWHELSALYEQADALDPAALAAWLARLRTDKHRLVAQLDRMLEARAKVAGGDFLESLPSLEPAATPGIESGWNEGSRIGAYRLIRPIGSGGMAEVWLAERADGSFARQVAIKLLFNHPSRAQRETFVERFKRERDILASLDHPNIARLHDAGVTPGGQPWLALEYVQGEPITAWCDSQRLTIDARVKLFQQVLLAVEHAHANLVIHRDLKPSNILVTSEGEVKLLDFGIAKLLESTAALQESTELTRQGGTPLTMQYASPEQLLGQALTTSCDVYALGVILYELVCGRRPYELSPGSAAQNERAILHVEPVLPSRQPASTEIASRRSIGQHEMQRRLRTDLDAVVLKPLEKQTASRYPSVEAFRSDLARWLAGEPVAARAPSATYRAGKFLRRHKLGAAVVSGGVMSLLVVAAVAVVAGIDARLQASRALATKEFVLDMFRMADPDQSKGADLTAREILSAGSKKAVESLSTQPALQAEVLASIAQIQSRMGEYVLADKTLAKVVSAYEQSGRPRERVLAELDLADNAFRLGDYSRSRSILDGASKVVTYKADHEIQAKRLLVAGWLLFAEGDPKRARVEMNSAIDHASAAFGPTDFRTIDALRGLAQIEGDGLDMPAASAHIAEAARRAASSSNVHESDLTGIALEQAKIEVASGRYGVADKLTADAGRICDASLGESSEDCVSLQNLRSGVLLRLGDIKGAALILPRLSRKANDSLSPRRQREALLAACRVLAANRMLDTEPAFRVRLEAMSRAQSPDSMATFAALTLAEIGLLEADPSRAISYATKVLESTDPRDRISIARARLLLGVALQREGRHAEALAHLDASNSEYEDLLGKTHTLVVLYKLNDAFSLRASGANAKALALIDKSLPTLTVQLGSSAPVVERIRALRRELSQPTRASSSGNPSPGDPELEFFT